MLNLIIFCQHCGQRIPAGTPDAFVEPPRVLVLAYECRCGEFTIVRADVRTFALYNLAGGPVEEFFDACAVHYVWRQSGPEETVPEN